MEREQVVWFLIGYLAAWVWCRVFNPRDYIGIAREKGKLPPGY